MPLWSVAAISWTRRISTRAGSQVMLEASPRRLSGAGCEPRGNRQQMIIATKVYQPMGELPNDRGLSRKHIIEALDVSLRRLRTDYIDLYLAHAFDAETPIEETLQALDDAQRAGKIRSRGASPYTLIDPESGARSPEMHSTLVVLPAPPGPMIPKISPSRMEKETECPASTFPYRLTRC